MKEWEEKAHAVSQRKKERKGMNPIILPPAMGKA